MERSYISFNASNIITINLMVIIGFFVVGAFASLYYMMSGTSANPVAAAQQS